jgi:peptide/nickel transport system substrate-binding protein
MPRKHGLWSLVLGAVVLMSMALVACGPSGGSPGGNSGGQAVKGGSMIDGLFEEPDTLLPFLTNETYSVMVDQALWAPLWYGDPQGALHAGIATDVPSVQNQGISADAKTYTIHLKPNLKWSDGSPLTADDLAFSLNLYANPDFANTFGFPLTTDPDGVASVNKVDSTTVSIAFKQPRVTINALLADGASSIIPQKVFGSMKPADVAKSTENFKPTVDSGPFMVKDRVQGSNITLVRNPNYYQDGRPYLDQVTFQIIPDQSTILTALQSGQIDSSWFLDVNKLTSYRGIQGYTTYVDPHPAGFENIVFNLTNPILADHNVRQALTESFKVDDLITQVWHGAAVKTCDDHGGTPFHEQNVTCYNYDPTDAGKLLDASGWTMGSDQLRHKGGKTLELRYSTTAGKAYREQTEVLAQAAWKKIGVKIDIVNYPANQYFAAGQKGILSSGNFDIGEFANTLGYDPDDHTTFQSDQTPDKGGSNYAHYSNPTVDQAEHDQVSNPDVNARKADFQKIHAEVLKDLPNMYYYTAANISVYNNKLHNYQPSPLGPSETWNIWDWWLTGGKSTH